MTRWRHLGWFLVVGLSVTMSLSYLSTTYLAAATSSDEEDEEPTDKKYATKIETPMIGDYTTFSGLQPVVLEGVGLVVGLNGTGGDPQPSIHRTQLLNELKRRGVKNPNQILASPNTALVLIRAYLPTLTKKGELLDVEVQLPESAESTSLAGGWLMDTYLSEQAYVPGSATPLMGHIFAKVKGAVLTAGIGSDASNSPELLKRGRVLGGATVLKERELSLFLRHDFRSVRNSQRIADVIGRRFHDFDEHGIKKPMAKAKTDQKIVLSVHPRYKDNYPRYLQVIRHLAFRESAVGARVRLQRLQKEIFTPAKAEECSLELEAIGTDSIPILKHALTSPLLEVRFYAATALAYLGNSDGLDALVESVRKERAFRVFALSAIATLDDAEAHMKLRELMSEQSAETRYGAFRALWTLDKRDPFIRGESLGISQDEVDDEKQASKVGEFNLHALDSLGEPMVHALTRTRPEIVLFGAQQEFRAPLYLPAGRHIIITAQPGASTATLARFEVGKPDIRRETSLQVGEIIRAAAEMGAHYPDIVQMLADASKQKNLSTRLGVDELPEGGRVYYRPDTTADGKSKGKRTKVGRPNMTPNLFPELDGPEGKERQKAEAKGNMANVPEENAKKKSTSDTESKDKEAASNRKSGEKDSKESKDADKNKGVFSWLGSWRRADK